MKLASLYNPYLFHKSIDTNMQKENMDSIKEKKTENWDFYDERKIILGLKYDKEMKMICKICTAQRVKTEIMASYNSTLRPHSDRMTLESSKRR